MPGYFAQSVHPAGAQHLDFCRAHPPGEFCVAHFGGLPIQVFEADAWLEFRCHAGQHPEFLDWRQLELPVNDN